MAKIEIIPAQASHIRSIANRMRVADRLEVDRASGKTPVAALSYSFRHSDRFRFTALVDGRPEVMFGVADLSILAGIGAVWLLGTDAVDEHFITFLRRSRQWRSKLFGQYSILRNFVDDQNAVSLRWLKWMGATFSEPVDIRGSSFRLFEMRAPDV